MANSLQYAGGLTVSLSVKNLDAGIDWYQRVLGFELVDDIGWCELKSPVEQVNVGLSVVEKPEPGGATPTFGVQDIEAAKTFLEGHDVRLDGDIVEIPDMVKLLTFYDQDGNTLMFFQVPAQA